MRPCPPDSVLAILAAELELRDGLVARWCPDCGFVEVGEDRALLYAELPCPRCNGNGHPS